MIRNEKKRNVSHCDTVIVATWETQIKTHCVSNGRLRNAQLHAPNFLATEIGIRYDSFLFCFSFLCELVHLSLWLAEKTDESAIQQSFSASCFSRSLFL